MAREPEQERRDVVAPEEDVERHLEYPQESYTEIDAEGGESEMSEGRQASEPFYTPLVTEAVERRRKRQQAKRSGSEKGESRTG